MNRGNLEAVVLTCDPRKKGSVGDICVNVHYERMPDKDYTAWYGTDSAMATVCHMSNKDVEVKQENGSIAAEQLSLVLKSFTPQQNIAIQVNEDTIVTNVGTFSICKVDATRDPADMIRMIKDCLPKDTTPLVALSAKILRKMADILRKSGGDVMFLFRDSADVRKPIRFTTDNGPDGPHGVIMPYSFSQDSLDQGES